MDAGIICQGCGSTVCTCPKDETLDVPYPIRGNKYEALIDAGKEIKSLRAHIKKHIQIEDKQQQEIESLKVENNNLLVMVSNQQKEIETLRSENKQLERRLGIKDAENTILFRELKEERAKTDIDLVNDPAAWDRLDKAIKRGDEWERRARLMHRERHFRNWMAFLANHPEAAEWFEEE